ncbi:MAG: creatininase family protein [Sedimentisphaerales bacterium]|nr:creatininase family protein [Sedimentisphaerales bacterium]
MYLNDLTWEEVRDYLTGKDGLIIPMGICEQHSRHLPLATDTLMAEYMAGYVAGATGVLVAPTFHYGVGTPCDRFFAGTTSISYDDLRNTVSSLISVWAGQGFKKFLLMSAHGDPIHLQALRDIEHEGVYVLELFALDVKDILEKQTHVKHADEGETSVMMYLFPERVRTNRIEDFETPEEVFKESLFHENTDPITGSPGCEGYPSYATKEKGRRIVELMKENALEWVRGCLAE